MKKILIISDSYHNVSWLESILNLPDCAYKSTFNLNQGFELFLRISPHLVMLDVTVSELKAIACYKQIRKISSIPIIMIAKEKQMDLKLTCLDMNVDDFLMMSENEKIINAKIMALLRRCYVYSLNKSKERMIKLNELEIDLDTKRVTIRGNKVRFRDKEFQILRCLVIHYGKPLSREQLVEYVWGSKWTPIDNSIINVHVRRIREKIEIDSSNPQMIKTVWGMGYKFNDC